MLIASAWKTACTTAASPNENDGSEPTLMPLLAYARVAAVHLEDIVDDNLDLPARLLGKVRYRGRRPKS
jgi:hypothetical protein